MSLGATDFLEEVSAAQDNNSKLCVIQENVMMTILKHRSGVTAVLTRR